MKSMTSYGQYEIQHERWSVSVEVRTLNARFLEIDPFLPARLRFLEQEIRNMVATTFLRGKVEIFVHMKEQNTPITSTVNAAIVEELIRIHTQYAPHIEKISLSTLANMGALRIEPLHEKEELSPILEALSLTLSICQEHRIREGKAISQSLRALSIQLREEFDALYAKLPDAIDQIRDAMLQRFHEMLGEHGDTNRVYTEIAAQLSKTSIKEEAERMREHLTHFISALDKQGGIGKHLDFLCQEMNREVTTMLAKLPTATLQRHAMTMKGTIEDLREQIRNVE